MSARSGGKPKRVPAAWAPLIDDYLLELAAAGQSERTLELRRHQLSWTARELGIPPQELDGGTLVAWFGAHTWSSEYRRSIRSGLRGFLSWAYRTGRLDRYLGDELPTVKGVKAVPRPAPDYAWAAALSNASPRVRLALRLAAEAGLRRAEVAQVHMRDFTDGVNGAQLLVHGKGGKPRVVPISDSLAAEIRRGPGAHTAGAPPDGWLFPTMVGGHLHAKWLGALVARELPDHWTMHTLRHRFASRAYRGSRNLRAVQELLGHASIATTERYTAVDDDEIRAAMMAALDTERI